MEFNGSAFVNDELEKARAKKWAEKALNGECDAVARETSGNRNSRLNLAAFNLGQLVGGGYLDAAVVTARLMAAAEACGYVAEDGHEAALSTINSGLTAGMEHPRHPKERPHQRRRQAAPEAEGIEVTEDGVALAFTERHGRTARFDHDAGRWFLWEGDHWRPDNAHRAYAWCREIARIASAGSDKKDLTTARKASFAGGVERMARSDPAHAVTQDTWDRDLWLLGCPGMTVDLRSGIGRAPDPGDCITKRTAVAPAHEADCPRWLAFLNETTGGDAAMIRFLQQWCGYGLTGDTSEHALIFVHGSGGNGKSVFLNAVTGILGDYAATAAMDTFTASKGDKHPTDLAMLRGARLVTASETEEGRAWAESRIKQLTGGDKITARFMRQDFFTYTPEFKLTIIGNHKPVLHNVDDAARRRFNIVPFTRKPERPDARLEEKLKAEWPGILRWMIEGCADWKANGLVRPESVRTATDAYFDTQDLFGQWLADECVVQPTNQHRWETSADLFKRWCDYAKAAGEDAGTQKRMGESMARRGFVQTQKRVDGRNQRAWLGLNVVRPEGRQHD